MYAVVGTADITPRDLLNKHNSPKQVTNFISH